MVVFCKIWLIESAGLSLVELVRQEFKGNSKYQSLLFWIVLQQPLIDGKNIQIIIQFNFIVLW